MADLTKTEDSAAGVVLTRTFQTRVRNAVVLLFIGGFSGCILWQGRAGPECVGLFLFVILAAAAYQLSAVATVRFNTGGKTLLRSLALFGVPFRASSFPLGEIEALQIRKESGRSTTWYLEARTRQGRTLPINSSSNAREIQDHGMDLANRLGLALLNERGTVISPSAAPEDATIHQEPGEAPNTLAIDPISAEHAEFERSEETQLPSETQSRAASEAGPGTAQPTGQSSGPPTLGPNSDVSPTSIGPAYETMPLGGSGEVEGAPIFSPAFDTAVPSNLDKTLPEAPEQSRGTVSELEQAVRTDPSDSAAWAELGGRYYDWRQYGRAAEAWREALKYDPLNAVTQNNLGAALIQAGQFKDAEGALNRAIALDPFAVGPRLNLVLDLARLGRKEEAAATLETARQYATDASGQARVAALQRGAMQEPLRG